MTYGWGMIPVSVRIGDTEWTTSLWPKDGALRRAAQGRRTSCRGDRARPRRDRPADGGRLGARALARRCAPDRRPGAAAGCGPPQRRDGGRAAPDRRPARPHQARWRRVPTWSCGAAWVPSYDPAELRDALDQQRLIEHQGYVRPSEDIALFRAEMAALARHRTAQGVAGRQRAVGRGQRRVPARHPRAPARRRPAPDAASSPTAARCRGSRRAGTTTATS